MEKYTQLGAELCVFLTQCYAAGHIEKNEMAGYVARMGDERGVHRMLVGKPEGMRPFWRPKRRWEDNIKMDVQEVEGGRWD
jgi:hypothetical protein